MITSIEADVKVLNFPIWIPGYGIVNDIFNWGIFLAHYKGIVDALNRHINYQAKIEAEIEYLHSLADPNFAWLDFEPTDENYYHDVD